MFQAQLCPFAERKAKTAYLFQVCYVKGAWVTSPKCIYKHCRLCNRTSQKASLHYTNDIVWANDTETVDLYLKMSSE